MTLGDAETKFTVDRKVVTATSKVIAFAIIAGGVHSVQRDENIVFLK